MTFPINEILVGDATEQLRKLPARSIHCVITSPPYWGLRDYGVPGQLGLESSPYEYIEKMVAIFRSVRRVLRHDGVLWLNMGDRYATGAGKVGDDPGGGIQGVRWKGDASRHRDDLRRDASIPNRALRDPKHAGKNTAMVAQGPMTQPNRMKIPGLKPKDLVGIPWRLAFALQADGWWLRQDNIWHKKNVMPESCLDRTTRSHEYVFQLTRSAHYFYDSIAVEEPQSEHERTRRLRDQQKGLTTSYKLRRDEAHGQTKPGQNGAARNSVARQILAQKGTRNKRSVWSIATQPFKEAHYAVFPEKLVEPCLLAGTSEKGACDFCGAQIRRVVKRKFYGDHNKARREALAVGHNTSGGMGNDVWYENYVAPQTIGWERTCGCTFGSTSPSVVLDPFSGAGTVAVVALKHGRRFIGIELNPEYAEIARRRIAPLMEGGATSEA